MDSKPFLALGSIFSLHGHSLILITPYLAISLLVSHECVFSCNIKPWKSHCKLQSITHPYSDLISTIGYILHVTVWTSLAHLDDPASRAVLQLAFPRPIPKLKWALWQSLDVITD